MAEHKGDVTIGGFSCRLTESCPFFSCLAAFTTLGALLFENGLSYSFVSFICGDFRKFYALGPFYLHWQYDRQQPDWVIRDFVDFTEPRSAVGVGMSTPGSFSIWRFFAAQEKIAATGGAGGRPT